MRSSEDTLALLRAHKRELDRLLGCNVDVCSKRALSARYSAMLEDATPV